MLDDSGRTSQTDRKFVADVADVSFSNHLFLRLVAARRRFTNVDFKYSIFDTSYMRDCQFDSCDFTGCRFVGTNLYGSSFSGCKFDYAIFERTHVDTALLDTECPAFENLKARFARTLRVNYQQLGDAQAANKAMRVELAATEDHLYKAWHSNESYYRYKYRGWNRVKHFFDWLQFKILDHVWGNGESAGRLLRFVIVILFIMACYDVLKFGDPHRIDSYSSAFLTASEIFLGVLAPDSYPRWYLALVTFVRLVAVGFFLSVIIKKFNRR